MTPQEWQAYTTLRAWAMSQLIALRELRRAASKTNAAWEVELIDKMVILIDRLWRATNKKLRNDMKASQLKEDTQDLSVSQPNIH